MLATRLFSYSKSPGNHPKAYVFHLFSFQLPLKYIPPVNHVILLRDPEHTPGIRNHAFALVRALDWTEQEGLAGRVHLVAGQHVALAVKQIPPTGSIRSLLEPVPAIGRIAAVCKLIPPALPVCGRLEALGVCHWSRRVIDVAEFERLLPGRGRHSGLDGPVVDALGLNAPAASYVYPNVSRLPHCPSNHGLIEMVDTYPLHGRVMVVVAATDVSGVPTDEATTVRTTLAYVLGRLGLVSRCVCTWILLGQSVQDSLGKDLALGAVDIGRAQLVLAVLN